MTRSILLFSAAFVASAASAAAPDAATTPNHAVGIDLAFSTDADDTSVLRTGANFDWRYHGPDDYLGLRLERLAYRPSGQARTTDERVYLRAADQLGAWTYHAAVGTDGHTVVGSVSANDQARFRKEIFVERDKVETPLGIAKPIFYTFGGATVDVPLGAATQLTLLGGLQDFTGSNVRTHARVNFIQVLKRDWGLSGQVRTRYFHNSDPGEYDYFSPRWYAEVLPVLQVRRFVGGWQYLAAGGWGAQRDSRSDWRQSRYLNVRVSSPAARRGWIISADATYSNVPITNSATYDYVRATLGLTRAF
jgi:hypothetical protein